MRAHWREARQDHIASRNAHKPKNAIRELRLLCQMTQAEFAVAIGLSRNTKSQISNMESRGLRPTQRHVALMNELAQKRGLTWIYSE